VIKISPQNLSKWKRDLINGLYKLIARPREKKNARLQESLIVESNINVEL
jgi:hypothetical protein